MKATMQTNQRKLTFPEMLNVRDLGGCTTMQGQQTRWRSLLRADKVSRLRASGEQALLDYGVRTIIDLRWPYEAHAEPSCLQQNPVAISYLHISLLGDSSDAWHTLRPEVPKEQWNSVVLEYAPKTICQVMQGIADAPAGALLFHCNSGKDRTGVVAALLLALAEVNPDEIAEDYACSTAELREPYLAAHPDKRAEILQSIHCPPENVHHMLAHLAARYQGVAGYLQHIGLSHAAITRLKSRLLESF